MTIREAFKKYRQVEIELLLGHVLKKPKEFLFANPEFEVSPMQSKRLAALAKQRKTGKPLAYIAGYKDFYGQRFAVSPAVLIPRPESEWLVEQALSVIPALSRKLGSSATAERNDRIKVLDLGTGSGCVIIALAKLLGPKGYQFIGADISRAALRVARNNARVHKVNVKFQQSNLFNKFNKLPQRFDCIIANLPYVRHREYQKLLAHLRFEPKRALTDSTNTWQLYEKFFVQVPLHLNPGGVILLETDPSSKNTLTTHINHFLPGRRTRFYKDLQGLWRYVVISNGFN